MVPPRRGGAALFSSRRAEERARVPRRGDSRLRYDAPVKAKHVTASKPKPRAKPDEEVRRTVARHPRAKFLYEIEETFEAGLVLLGTEVKALREGKAQLQEAFGRFRGRELFLVKCHIPEYRSASQANHEPTRPRKLLLHATELAKLHARVSQKGLTLVPLSLYFNEDGRAKLELALARGRKIYDKREAIRTREARVDVRRASRR